MKIYVATSWRNAHQQSVVLALREDGHEVYDFKDNDGFRWSEVDPNWKEWNPKQYIEGLCSPRANSGFNRDMINLRNCEVCVYVMPCGPSASLEAGYAVGASKLVVVYIPELKEPDLMVKMAHLITDDLTEIRKKLKSYETLRKEFRRL